jgi:hypothetical protein
VARTTFRLSQELQAAPEERFELLGSAGGFGFAHGGFGIGAGGTEVKQRGKDILLNGVEGGRGWGGAAGGGYGNHLVAQFEDHAFGGLLAHSRDAYKLFDGAVAKGVDKVGSGEAGENGDGQFGADAGYADELLEHSLFVLGEEAEEGEGVFADVGVDTEAHFGTYVGKAGVGGDGDREIVADASGFHNGLVGVLFEERSTNVSNHQ